jgi:hypothetical protein
MKRLLSSTIWPSERLWPGDLYSRRAAWMTCGRGRGSKGGWTIRSAVSKARTCSHKERLFPTREKSHHERLKVGRPQGDRLESLVDDVEQLAACRPLVLAALAELADELGRDVERRAEFDDGPAPELVSVEVRQADGHNLEPEVRVGGHRAEGHDGDAGLEREQIGPVVGSPFARARTGASGRVSKGGGPASRVWSRGPPETSVNSPSGKMHRHLPSDRCR